MYRSLSTLILGGALLGAVGCAHTPAPAPTESTLDLERVVLYRNGIGYFERTGTVEGNVLKIRCRKDQINDILKSLTVVDRSSGQAVSVSMPLDPQSWANAALTTLAPGQGNLAEVLDALRGTEVKVSARSGPLSGRIMMVEVLESFEDEESSVDHRLALLKGSEMQFVLVSEINSISFADENLVMQLDRTLDATAGENMFQQVTVEVFLEGTEKHDLMISYVVPAPLWKPTYRVVLPGKADEPALLQAWAVVDNTTGEDWFDVDLSLTSGAPIAFRYDLHTPITLDRPDMTGSGTMRRARVARGDTTFESARRDEVMAKRKMEERRMRNAPPAAPSPSMRGAGRGGGGIGGGLGDLDGAYDMPAEEAWAEAEMAEEEDNGVFMNQLRESTQANTTAHTASGLTRYELENRVTVPDGTSTMVAILNEEVEAEETFLYRPGGGGPGYEANPYRVVRFKNSTPFALEPGPIAIYSGGSFVGEGLADAIATETSATIPFSVEPTILVHSQRNASTGATALVRLSEEAMLVETSYRIATTWSVKVQKREEPFRIFVRQPRAGGNYALKDRPAGTEELSDAWLIPIQVPAGMTEVSLEVIEEAPTRTTLSIWSPGAFAVIDAAFTSKEISAQDKRKLRPIVEATRELADIDTRIANLKRQQIEVDQRANETRANLQAIEKDTRAKDLRARLTKRLEEFSREGDRLGREIVELTSKRLEKKIELDDTLDNFLFEPTPPKTPKEGDKEDKGEKDGEEG